MVNRRCSPRFAQTCLFRWPKRSPPPSSLIGSDDAFYYLVVCTGILVFLLVARFVVSPSGRTFIAIRDSEVAAATVGISVTFTRTAAFVLSAMLTGRLPRSSWRWERLQDALHDALAIKAAADAAADAKRQELRQARPLPRLRQL